MFLLRTALRKQLYSGKSEPLDDDESNKKEKWKVRLKPHFQTFGGHNKMYQNSQEFVVKPKQFSVVNILQSCNMYGTTIPPL